MEFRTKREAVANALELELRAIAYDMQMRWPREDGSSPNDAKAAACRAEAARIRALLPTLPE
jgi:hypothetical protein